MRVHACVCACVCQSEGKGPRKPQGSTSLPGNTCGQQQVAWLCPPVSLGGSWGLRVTGQGGAWSRPLPTGAWSCHMSVGLGVRLAKVRGLGRGGTKATTQATFSPHTPPVLTGSGTPSHRWELTGCPLSCPRCPAWLNQALGSPPGKGCPSYPHLLSEVTQQAPQAARPKATSSTPYATGVRSPSL